jgi:hypothetical protein
MQPPFGSVGEAAFLGNRNEIAQMPELHRVEPYLKGMA